MYRIRTAEGNETVYDSLEEFSAAVRRGAVTPDDEIFHTRAGRWLDIKSHPHYRSALTLNAGGASHAGVGSTPTPASGRPASAGSAPAPTPPPRPVQQTVYRHQLQPPTPKSKELTFIDVDGTVVPPGTERNATIIRAPRVPPKPTPRPTPAPVAKPKPETPPAAEREGFLVMDGGIESPVRTSSGHRTVSDDLDLLFDAPLPPVEPLPAKVATTPAAAQPPKPGLTAVRPQPPAPPAPARASGPVAAAASAPAPATSSAPVAPPAPAPKPDVKPASAPAASGATPAVAAVAAPLTASVHPAPSVAEDLDIPGGPLLTEPAPVAVKPSPAPAAPRPTRLLLGAGIAAVVITGALLAWRPWQAGSAAADVAAQTAPDALDSASAGAAPAPPAAATGATTAAGPSPATTGAIKPVAAIGPTAAPGGDSSTEAPGEEIIAAVRPNFRADAVISTADIGLSASGSTARPSAVAPSELARRVELAEKSAQADLTTRLSSAGFRSVLAPSRIGSAEGAASARNAWIAGADAIRQYRARIGRIEKAYEDSMLMSQRAERWPVQELRAWGARTSLAEPGDVSQLADLMFSQITEALDLLAALGGQYEMKNGLIQFRSPGAESRYTSIRNWVEQRMHTWAATPASARPHSVAMILQALGDGLPAVK